MKLLILLPGNVRSGVDFFQSLIDGHDQISQLPGLFYVDEFLNNINKNDDAEKIVNKFIAKYENYFDSRIDPETERHNLLGINKNEFYLIDKIKFKKSFKNLLANQEINNENILKSINLAYSEASGKDIKKIKLIIIQIHHIHRIDIIKNLDFEILFTFRNPLSSLSSYMSNLAYFKRSTPMPWPFYYNCTRALINFKKILKLKKKSFVIKLEDLHVNNEITMKNFCKIFNLDYDNCMKTSTFHKKLWWGDAVSKINLNGVNKKFEEKINKKNFFNKDILYIQYYFSTLFEKYGYKKMIINYNFLRINSLLPLKFELIIFFKNLVRLRLQTALYAIYYYLKRIKNINVIEKNILPKKI